MKATLVPSRDTRGCETHPSVTKRTLPIGISSRVFPSTSLTTASVSPSGAQSASRTASRMSRGARPPMGARARVPEASKRDRKVRPTERAISPDGETERTSASGSSARCGSGLPGCATKRRIGAPSQAAPKTTVFPSGPKRAERMLPREKVRRVISGGPVGAPARPAHQPAPRRIAARARAPATAPATTAARPLRRAGTTGRSAAVVRGTLAAPTASSANATSRADWNLQRRVLLETPPHEPLEAGRDRRDAPRKVGRVVHQDGDHRVGGRRTGEGGRPERSSKRRVPSAKMSDRPSTASPRTCSGDM